MARVRMKHHLDSGTLRISAQNSGMSVIHRATRCVCVRHVSVGRKCGRRLWSLWKRCWLAPLQTSLLSHGLDGLSERRHCPCSGPSRSSRVNSLKQAGGRWPRGPQQGYTRVRMKGRGSGGRRGDLKERFVYVPLSNPPPQFFPFVTFSHIHPAVFRCRP